MKWWREARFGMFVHWGLYSGLAGTWDGKPVGTRGGMEWIQERVHADTETYAQRALPLFKPKPGFAREWARLAKEAGCEYVVFTTKHHDGFALHDSRVSDFDAGSMLGRDLVKEIVTALRAEGLRVGFYHSVIDWHHDQYEYERAEQLPHPLKGKPYPNGDRTHARYVDFLHAQMDELVTNYRTVDVLWWDYSSQKFQGQEAWRAFDLMRLVRAKQPRVVMNNRLFRSPEAGWTSMATDGIGTRLDPRYGDFLTPEQHIPPAGLPGVDWETCMTMNTTWGYSDHDSAWKSDTELIRNLIETASKGGNFLLNIGPQGDGSVPAPSVASLRAIGNWMKLNGESIHGASAGPLTDLPWGRCTHKTSGNVQTLYLHVFEWPQTGQLKVTGVPGEPIKAHLLADKKKKPLPLANAPDGVLISVPPMPPDAASTTIVLRLAAVSKER